MSKLQASVKRCTKCEAVKPLVDFGSDKSKKSGLKFRCKACVCQDDRDRRAANPEKYRAAVAKWAKANPEKSRANKLKWAKANPEKVLTINLKWEKAHPDRAKAWAKANPDKRLLIGANRRAAKLQRTPTWVDREAIKQIYTECSIRRTQGEDVQVDHIIPLQGELVSGLHVAENLRIVSSFENRSKKNKFDPLTKAKHDPDQTTLPEG